MDSASVQQMIDSLPGVDMASLPPDLQGLLADALGSLADLRDVLEDLGSDSDSLYREWDENDE